MRFPSERRNVPGEESPRSARGKDSDYFADLVREELEGTAEAARRWLQVIRDGRK